MPHAVQFDRVGQRLGDMILADEIAKRLGAIPTGDDRILILLGTGAVHPNLDGMMTQNRNLPVRGLRTRVPRLGLLHISGLTRFTAPPRGAHWPTATSSQGFKSRENRIFLRLMPLFVKRRTKDISRLRCRSPRIGEKMKRTKI